MSKHTNEPWATEYRERPDGMFAQEIFDADGETIATMAWYPVKDRCGTTTNRKDNARRVVACVNACRGLDTEILETILMLGETLLDRFELRNRVDAELTWKVDSLLSAMRRIEAYPETKLKELGIEAIKAIARVAIEKIEGGDE